MMAVSCACNSRTFGEGEKSIRIPLSRGLAIHRSVSGSTIVGFAHGVKSAPGVSRPRFWGAKKQAGPADHKTPPPQGCNGPEPAYVRRRQHIQTATEQKNAHQETHQRAFWNR